MDVEWAYRLARKKNSLVAWLGHMWASFYMKSYKHSPMGLAKEGIGYLKTVW